MKELIASYAPFIIDVALRGAFIAFLTLGFVYIVGRMLCILHNNTAKNVVALIAMIGVAYWSTLIYDKGLVSGKLEVYWRVLIYVCAASVFYVLVGFSLYDRVNAWANAKFGEPKKREPRALKKKRGAAK